MTVSTKVKKNSLIFLAHGSRRKESNQEIENLFKEIAPLIFKNYAVAQVAFLELADPSLEITIDDFILNKKVAAIKIFPYFLAAGNHIAKDIPSLIKEAQEKHRHKIPITILDYFGKTKNLSDFIAKSIVNN